MNKLLIQANNLDTVIDTFMYLHQHPDCTKDQLAEFCGFSLRQVDYYTNACKYLDLINDDWSMTTLAVDIFTNYPANVREKVYERIISDDLIGLVFARLFTFPDEDHSEYVKEIVTDSFPGYSDAVYERRSDNLIKWCKKIINYYCK